LGSDVFLKALCAVLTLSLINVNGRRNIAVPYNISLLRRGESMLIIDQFSRAGIANLLQCE
jgi:hypothetical protein